MRVLIIGGTKLMGPYAVQHLIAGGHEVAVFNRGKTPADLPDQVQHIQHLDYPLGNRHYYPDFAEEFKQFAPDVVVDMIAFTQEDAEIAMNTFRGLAKRLVVMSSIDVYQAYGRLHGTEPGPLQPLPLTEKSALREKHFTARGQTPRPLDDPYRFMDDYEKILVEQVVMNNQELPGTVLRLPMVYGNNDRGRLWPYLKRMDDKRPAILLDETLAGWRACRAYAEEMGAAIALTVTDERAAGQIYHIAEPESPTEKEWAQEIGQLVGWDGEIVVLPKEKMPEHLLSPADMSQHWVVDSSRIRQELGYTEMIPREERLRRTIAATRANPPAEFDPNHFNYEAEDAALSQQ